MTVSAEKVLTEYPIEYILNDGSFPTEDVPVSYTVESEAVTLPVPEKKGFRFLGWTGTDLAEQTASVTIPAGSTGERCYTAEWEEILVSSVSWELADGTALSPLEALPEDGLLPESASFAASGSETVESGADFLFAVQTEYAYPLVYANDELLDAVSGGEGADFYQLTEVTAAQFIDVREGVLCMILLPEGSTFEADAPGARQEEADGGILMTIPMGGPVSFELDDSVLVYLNDEELVPVDGVYDFLAVEDAELRFVPCIHVDDGSLSTLRAALADAAESDRTVVIGCTITVPTDTVLSFDVPVVLAKSQTLTLEADASINAPFTNEGRLEVMENAVLTINEPLTISKGGYFCNNGSITVGADAELVVFGGLDNLTGGVITLEKGTTSAQSARLQSEGLIQNYGTVVNTDNIENLGGTYRLYTDDASLLVPYENQLLLPDYLTEITFTGDLTVESGKTLYVNSATIRIGSGGKLTVEETATVLLNVIIVFDPVGCLYLEDGSELILNGSITMTDPAGFADSENRYTTQPLTETTWKVVTAEPAV